MSKDIHTYEATLLGQIIKFPEIIPNLRISEEAFSSYKHQLIFRAVKELIDNDVRPDLLTVIDRLKQMSASIEPSYLAKITNIPTSANWSFYQAKILNHHHRTQIKKIIMEAMEKLKDPTEEPAKIIQSLHSELETCSDIEQIYQTKPINDILLETIETIEQHYRDGGVKVRFVTGIEKLDDLLIGEPNGRLYYIGGRPSDGKTTLLLNIAIHQAKNNIPVGIISLESSFRELMFRILASETFIDSKRLFQGLLTQEDFDTLIDASGNLAGLPIHFYDEPNLMLDKVISKIRHFVDIGCKVVFIDYLQLIYAPNLDVPRHEEIAYISKMLKDYARKFNIPIMVTAQLRRDSEGRRPRLGDFSESSQIEKDADVAILIYNRRKEEFREGVYKVLADEWFLCVDKNRDGEKKVVPVIFDKEHQTFKSKNYEDNYTNDEYNNERF